MASMLNVDFPFLALEASSVNPTYIHAILEAERLENLKGYIYSPPSLFFPL